MKTSTIALTLSLAAWQLPAQITGTVMTRVFQIRVGEGTGTAFVIEHENQEYVVTANHVVGALGDKGKIELMNNAHWFPFEVRIAHSRRKCVDIAVMQTLSKQQLTNTKPLLTASSFFMGQEVFFLGFPYGLSMHASTLNLTIPLIKHGYISADMPCSAFDRDAASDDNLLLLDGFNNPGFSGGPVIIHDLSAPDRALKVIGVISGFRGFKTPVTVDGKPVAGATVETNTGIIDVIPMRYAAELIKELRKSVVK